MNKPWCSAVNCFLLEQHPAMPMCLAQPGREKQAQKLGQWPAGPEMDPRFRLSARQKERGLQIIREHRKTKTRWVRGLAQHHMARWWQTGTQLVFLHCPALWLLNVYSYPYPRGKATTPALHEHGSGTKGLWGLSCLLFFFTQLNGFFTGKQLTSMMQCPFLFSWAPNSSLHLIGTQWQQLNKEINKWLSEFVLFH